MLKNGYQVRLARVQSLVALVAISVALSLASPAFLTPDNALNILRQISGNLCLSIGMTVVILTGGIDLSVGAVLALAGAMAARLIKFGVTWHAAGLHFEFTLSGAIAVALLAGCGLGLFNGIAVTKLRLPPFVATLAMLSIARGFTFLWTGGYPITGLPSGFGFMGSGSWLGVPMQVWIVGMLAVMFMLIAGQTAFGRHLYAVGGSERAARLSGVSVDHTKLAAYAICGTLSGLAGLLVTARLDSAQPNAGLGYELDSIAAVVIGGASLSGGRGSIAGTVLGCLIIGVLNNGLFLLDVSPFWQQSIKGAVILLAVAVDRLSEKETA